MAVETVDALAELTSPASNDEVGIWDVSAGQFKKIQVSNLLGGVIAGGGTIATGGFTLTVPATGTAALRSGNTFTDAQIIAPTPTNVDALTINMPSGATAFGLVCQLNTATLMRLYGQAGGTQLQLPDRNVGNNAAGATCLFGRNTSASANGPAPGALGLTSADGAVSYMWVDDSDVLRINTNNPATGNAGSPTVHANTGGTVVGAQTSSLDSKHVIGAPLGIDDVLAAIAAGADAVRRFTYKSGAYNGEEFSGVVTDFAPRYGMDRDGDHPAGKSLNVITVIGDLLLAVANLAARVAALEAGAG